MTTATESAGDLRSTEFLDHESAQVRDFVARTLPDGGGTPTEQAVALYYRVRDKVRYEVYGADLSRAGLRASQVLQDKSGMCIHKSVVYAAALRAVGIPSRLVLTDVRNHLSSPRLRDLVGGDVFHFHCLTSVHLAGRWIRATPVFNKMLCTLYRIAPLEFDGSGDSLYHPYDGEGRRHMEFLHDHGEFSDLPYQLIIDGLREHHPRLFTAGTRFAGGSLVADASHPRHHQSPGDRNG